MTETSTQLFKFCKDPATNVQKPWSNDWNKYTFLIIFTKTLIFLIRKLQKFQQVNWIKDTLKAFLWAFQKPSNNDWNKYETWFQKVTKYFLIWINMWQNEQYSIIINLKKIKYLVHSCETMIFFIKSQNFLNILFLSAINAET